MSARVDDVGWTRRQRIAIRALAIGFGFIVWWKAFALAAHNLDISLLPSWLLMMLIATYAAVPLFKMAPGPSSPPTRPPDTRPPPGPSQPPPPTR